MPDWSRREHAVTTVEYVIPCNGLWGACWNEVSNALSAAIRDVQQVDHKVPSDDAIRVFAGDDEIIISYKKSEEFSYD